MILCGSLGFPPPALASGLGCFSALVFRQLPASFGEIGARLFEFFLNLVAVFVRFGQIPGVASQFQLRHDMACQDLQALSLIVAELTWNFINDTQGTEGVPVR